MSFQIPKTFYGAGYAVCAVLFSVSFIAPDIDDRLRITGIVLASIFFMVVTLVYLWDKGKYYYDIAGRP